MTMARILIVDADKHIRGLFSIELSEQGHEVTAAGSCHKLLERIEISQPDLLILDINQSECDGPDVLQEIRRNHVDLRIIICSVYDSCKYGLRALAADHFVIKSYDLTELKTTINRVLEAKGPVHHRAEM